MKKVGIIVSKDLTKNNNYVAAVSEIGAEVVVFDPDSEDADVDLLIREIDGLIIPGGVDVQPSYYHEENVACGELNPELDVYEMDVLSKAVEANKPVLGICRGAQLINVFFGGSLYQDIFCSASHKRDKNIDRVHVTKVDRDSFLYKIYGKNEISVNSAHHQAVKDIGKDLVPIQYSKEGILEAFYHKYKPIYAVQWHPERMCLKNARNDTEDGLKVFRYFLELL